MSPGELGVWLSHLSVARQATRERHLHVLEDDAQFSPRTLPALQSALAAVGEEAWDLIFTDVLPSLELSTFAALTEQVNNQASTGRVALVNLEQLEFTGMTSFLINRHTLDRYVGLMDNGWRTHVPVDLFLLNLIRQKKLRAFVTAPFLTTLSSHSARSQIGVGADSLLAHVIINYRRAFFIDADLDALHREIAELTASASLEPLPMIYIRVLAFLLSNQFRMIQPQ